jgi:hypothetical protein
MWKIMLGVQYVIRLFTMACILACILYMFHLLDCPLNVENRTYAYNQALYKYFKMRLKIRKG